MGSSIHCSISESNVLKNNNAVRKLIQGTGDLVIMNQYICIMQNWSLRLERELGTFIYQIFVFYKADRRKLITHAWGKRPRSDIIHVLKLLSHGGACLWKRSFHRWCPSIPLWTARRSSSSAFNLIYNWREARSLYEIQMELLSLGAFWRALHKLNILYSENNAESHTEPRPLLWPPRQFPDSKLATNFQFINRTTKNLQGLLRLCAWMRVRLTRTENSDTYRWKIFPF